MGDDCRSAECIFPKRNVIDDVKRQVASAKEKEAISFLPASNNGHDMYPSHPMNEPNFQSVFEAFKINVIRPAVGEVF